MLSEESSTLQSLSSTQKSMFMVKSTLESNVRLCPTAKTWPKLGHLLRPPLLGDRWGETYISPLTKLESIRGFIANVKLKTDRAVQQTTGQTINTQRKEQARIKTKG